MFKRQIRDKDEELKFLKSSIKVVKFNELVAEHHKVCKEYNELKVQHENTKQNLSEYEYAFYLKLNLYPFLILSNNPSLIF